jgi:hypothetical protein
MARERWEYGQLAYRREWPKDAERSVLRCDLLHPTGEEETLDPPPHLMEKLNELGREGWEVFDIEVSRYAWRDPDRDYLPRGLWDQKLYWLKRRLG